MSTWIHSTWWYTLGDARDDDFSPSREVKDFYCGKSRSQSRRTLTRNRARDPPLALVPKPDPALGRLLYNSREGEVGVRLADLFLTPDLIHL